MTTDARFTRQARLVEVGESGQARLAGASVHVAGDGAKADVEARYLRGAGVRVVLAGRRACDDLSDPEPPWMDGLTPAAREVASGAYGALIAIRAVLSGAAHPRVEDEP